MAAARVWREHRMGSRKKAWGAPGGTLAEEDEESCSVTENILLDSEIHLLLKALD